jgi:phosphate transport system substrate-binding protein
LTLAQLRGIYDGSITDWSAAAPPSPIKVYLPQTGSGTLAYFTSVLGFDPTTKPVTISRVQQNDATSVAAADLASAIAPFSAAQFVAQGNNVVTPDKRAGSAWAPSPVLVPTGRRSPALPAPTPAYLLAFLGAHTAYHVVDTRTPSYGAALNIVGWDALGPSSLCNNDLASTLTQYSFQPLPFTAGVTCTKE